MPWGGEGGIPYKNDGGARRTYWGKNAVLVLLRMLSLKRSTAGARSGSFCDTRSRVLSRKNMTGDNVLCTSKGEKNFKPRPHLA